MNMQTSITAAPAKPFLIAAARYAKGKLAVSVRNEDAFKHTASYLAEAVGGRWTNRESAYIMSVSQGDKFYALFHAGFDVVSALDMRITHPDYPQVRLTVAEAYKIATVALFNAKLVAIDPTLEIAQGAIIVCQRDLAFRVGGRGRLVEIKAGDRCWITNSTYDQARSGLIVFDRDGKGVISHGWHMDARTVAEFFKVEPDKQVEA